MSYDADCKKMMGLALKNVTLTLHEDGKAIFEEQGEMLFTHFGISGPLTLSASSHLGDMKKHKYEAFIDLKPALSEEQLYDRITRDFALLANHAAQGALVKLLPSSMQPVMVARAMPQFRGVDRRFDFKIKNSHIVFLSDYAHHPEEIGRAHV